MDGWIRYRSCALALLGGAGLLAAAAPVRAERLVQATTQFEPATAVAPTIDVRRAAAALQGYAQEVVGALSADWTALTMTMIGGHVIVPTTPPPPPTPTGSPSPPPPPTTTGGTPTPPPPPTTTGSTPTPPPPTTQGGPGPSGAPEPATIVTGLLGLGIASAAGWYRRRRR
jgi:hypothetical protein